ncbi:MAG: hypothetical protein ACKOW9_05515 [Candidatus Paceibacterota bacterium]
MAGFAVLRYFQELLKTPLLDLQSQKRVYQFANSKNESNLLTRLAAYPDLHPEVDTLLRSSKLASVKSAWASRPNRSPEDLAAMVKGEKRVSILSALAKATDLPNEVYSAIIKNSKSKTPLLDLAANAEIDTKFRVQALKRVLKIQDNNTLNRTEKYHQASNALRTLMGTDFELEKVTSDPLILSAALEIRSLSVEQQIIVANYLNSITRTVANGYDESHELIIRIAESMIERGNVDPLAVEITLKVLEREAAMMAKTRFTYRVSSIQTLITRFKEESDLDTAELEREVNSINDPDAMDKFIEKVKTRTTGKAPLSSQRLENLAWLIVANRHSNLKHMGRISDWFGYNFQKDVVKLTSDPDKLAYAFLSSYYIDTDILHELHNAKEVVNSIVSICKAEQKPLPHSIMHSQHLTYEMLLDLPLLHVLEDVVPELLKQQLLNKLQKEIDTQESWENFVALADEFEGSVNELLSMINKI